MEILLQRAPATPRALQTPQLALTRKALRICGGAFGDYVLVEAVEASSGGESQVAAQIIPCAPRQRPSFNAALAAALCGRGEGCDSMNVRVLPGERLAVAVVDACSFSCDSSMEDGGHLFDVDSIRPLLTGVTVGRSSCLLCTIAPSRTVCLRVHDDGWPASAAVVQLSARCEVTLRQSGGRAAELAAVPKLTEETWEEEARAWAARVEESVLGHGEAVLRITRQLCLCVAKPLAFPAGFPSQGFLFTGVPGVGKSAVASALLSTATAFRTVQVDSSSLFARRIGDSEAALDAAFQSAVAAAPCLLLFDDLDAIAAADSSDPLQLRMLDGMLTWLARLRDERLPVWLLATAGRKQAVSSLLTAPTMLSDTVALLPPEEEARLALLRAAVSGTRCDELDLQWVAQQTMGFVAADVHKLCREAMLHAIGSDASASKEEEEGAVVEAAAAAEEGGGGEREDAYTPAVSRACFQAALLTVRPSTLASQQRTSFELSSFDELGGVESAAEQLRMAAVLPLSSPESLRRLGVSPPRGILIHGPSGCGKSSLVRALAAECRANFVAVRCSDLLSKWVGASEAALAALFRRARAAAPCVLYLARLDSIAPVRGHDSSSERTLDRLLSCLLTEMDGVSASSDRLLILASTDRIGSLDSAILRAGRLDVHVRVPPLDVSGRTAVLHKQLAKVQLAGDAADMAAKLAKKTPGATGAQLAGYVRQAAMAAMREDLYTARVRLEHLYAAAGCRVMAESGGCAGGCACCDG